MTVTARHLEVLSFDGETARLSMQVTAGFYVRSLAHDLGEALGCGAVLMALRRTRSGEFGLEPAVPLADVLQSSREQLAAKLVPMAALLPDLPSVTLRGQANVERLKNGVEMGPDDLVTPLGVRTAAPEAPLVRSRGAGGAAKIHCPASRWSGRPGRAGKAGKNARVSPWLGGSGVIRLHSSSFGETGISSNIARLQAKSKSPYTAAW